MGVRVSQVKPSNCFRRLEKLVLPSNLSFDNSFEGKCDILEGEHTLTAPSYFHGGQNLHPHDLHPAIRFRIRSKQQCYVLIVI